MCTNTENIETEEDEIIEVERNENGEMLVSDCSGCYKSFSNFDFMKGHLVKMENPDKKGYTFVYKLYTQRELYFNKLINITIWVYEEYIDQKNELIAKLKIIEEEAERKILRKNLIMLYDTYNKKVIEFKHYQKLFNECTD